MNPADFGDVNKINAPIDAGTGRTRFNLTAMVSVLMFLLVTFAMFSLALMKVEVMETNIPIVGGEPGTPLIVQVSSGREVFIDKISYDISELPALLDAYKERCIKNGANPQVTLSGDNYANYGSWVHAMDQIRKSGIERIVVETNYRATGR